MSTTKDTENRDAITTVVDQDDVERDFDKPSIQEDEAGQFLAQHDVDLIASTATDADYKALVRKMDRRIMPLLFGTYALQCIDKSCLGYASVFTLSHDLGLVGKQ